MAGPPRTSRARSPFAQDDDGHQVYSPLANLVRKASNNHSSGGVPTYASLGLNRSTGTATSSSDSRPGNSRSVSDQQLTQRPSMGQPKKSAPPNLVLREPEEVLGQGHQSHRRAQPSSPLLHTRFRASVATSIGSSSDLDARDSQEVDYPFHPHHSAQPNSGSGSDSAYTPSPTTHRPFAYVVDDTHAGAVPSPTSQYSARQESLPPSPNQPFQFDVRTSVAPSEDIRPPFQYDPRASSVTTSTDAPFQYDDSTPATNTPSKLSSSILPPSRFSNNIHSTRSSNYNPRGTWRSSAAPEPDPFSFRDYEAPRVEPPIVVVHSPMSAIQDRGDEELDADRIYLGDSQEGGRTSQGQGQGGGEGLGEDEEDVGSTPYHDAYEYVYGAIEADDNPDEEEERTETGDHYYKPVAASSQPISEPDPTLAYYEPTRDSTASETDNFFQPDPDPEPYFAPAPEPVALPAAVSSGSVASSAGRVASVVAGGRGYNYSRPMRAGGGSISGNIPGQVANQGQGGGDGSTGVSASAGRSPLRKATGPLIFQTSPEELGSQPVEQQQRTGRSPSPQTQAQEYERPSPDPRSHGEQYSNSPRQTPDSQYANHQYAGSSGSQYAQTPNSQYAQTPNSQYAQTPNSQYSNLPSSQYAQTPNSQLGSSTNSPTGRPPSLYSQYSFYSLPGSTPPESPRATPDQRPIGPGQLRQKPSGSLLNPNAQQGRGSPSTSSTSSPTDTPTTKSLNPNASKTNNVAQQYLTRGIQAHEQNNLRESARCFERSASEGGGCGVGMLMWGLSLRHGWGCRKDERTGFRWLRRAAEAAVADLESARSGEEAKAVRNELVLAIYEVGQCFFHGWGVGQDKVMAVSYFQVAARLGDCDAQQELAFCYLNGKGCKKDMKEAARWYRAAAAQGASTVGLAWIYKPKYT